MNLTSLDMYKNICEKELYQSDGEDHPHIKILKSRFSEILFKSLRFHYFILSLIKNLLIMSKPDKCCIII